MRVQMGRALLGLPLLWAVGAGCGDSPGRVGPTYEVTGQVLLKDGKPLKAGRVTFLAADDLSPPASGAIGADGRFTLTTKVEGDGAVPGQYKIRVEPATSVVKNGATKPPFPAKYVDADSSGLAATVKAEPNKLDPITLR